MIEAKNLSKHFGPKVAVDGISFTVGKGEVLGFLGPNAAGKSTTMRMITGFLPPTSGTAVIGGDDIIGNSLAARRKIGYLPENAPAYPEMSVLGFLDFIADIRNFTGSDKTKRVEETLQRCFLNEVRHQTINTLSKGFKQRVCFAQSIIHDPEYLIMDEPTDGLDPNQKHEVRGMIRDMAREKTIILSTHILEEVDAVCTRAIIIAEGKIVADDTPERLKARSKLHGAICFTLPPRDGETEQETLQGVEQILGIREAEVINLNDGDVTIRALPQDQSAPPVDRVIRHFLEIGRPVKSLFVEEGDLNEVFRTITTSQAGDASK